MNYRSIDVNGLNIFYRECGDPSHPTMVLFHGFPSASHMFRDLMPMLEEHFHLIAPDYPGFGQSESPSRDGFAYTFDHLAEVMESFLAAIGVDKFYMYVFDYGAPIGFRIAMKYPERILGIISQNGNVYEEGLGKKWEARAEYWKNPTTELREQYKSAFAKDTVIGQYTFGTEEGSVSPDGYSLDLYYAATIPDYAEKQSDLIFDYQNNVKLYPAFQKYLREHQPKLLAIWGKEDPSFIWAGAEAFAKDLPNAKIIPVNSGHFALENCFAEIAEEIKEFFEDSLIYNSQIDSTEEIEAHGTTTLWTERMVLRRYRIEDADDLHRYLGTDPAMYQYSGWNPYATPEMAQETVRRFIGSYEDVHAYSWVIDVDGVIVGTIGAYDYKDDHIEAGFSIVPSWQGRGLATEALKKVLEYLTENEGIPCVTAWCAADNAGSKRVLEKTGMKLVCTEKDGLVVGDKVYDKLIYEYRK